MQQDYNNPQTLPLIRIKFKATNAFASNTTKVYTPPPPPQPDLSGIPNQWFWKAF